MTGVASSSRFAILRTSLEVELDEELATISCPDGADVAPETLHLWIASDAGTSQRRRGPGERRRLE